MKIILITVMLLLPCLGAFAESGQTPPLNQNTSHNIKHAANNNQPTYKYTYESPFKVSLSPPPKDIPERKEYDSGQVRKTNVELWTLVIAIITAIILLFQAIAFFIQARRLRRTVEATERTVKSLQDSERPYIFIKIWGCYFKSLGNGLAEWRCECDARNYGKTPAILTNIRVCIYYCEDNSLPAEIPNSDEIPRGGAVIGVKDSSYRFAHLSYTMDFVEARRIESGEMLEKLFCYGRIDYEDIFGERHYTKFCWVYQNRGTERGFYLSKNKELNDYT